MTRKYIAAAASIGVIALVVAGCGSSGSSGNSSSTAAAPASSGSGPTVTASSSSLGKIVTDSKGRTLYLFAKDTGGKSMCAGACSTNWLPYTVSSKPAAGSGVTAGAISLVKRADGGKQVTLNGHPLYYFRGDQAPGQLNGQGVNEFGAKWFAVAPSGMQVTASAKPSGGSGYSY